MTELHFFKFFLITSGQFCEAAVSPPSPCQLARCQNDATCVEKSGVAVCQCPPGFEGQSCEKLVSVNFVDRDSYVQLQDVKNWPQANITLQVRRGEWGGGRGGEGEVRPQT